MVDPSSLDAQLLLLARRIARLDANRPAQANLRRAVSTAYYSLFHFLVNHGCALVLGTSNETKPFRAILARGFQHGSMQNVCKWFTRGGSFPRAIMSTLPTAFVTPPEVADIAETFVQAMEKRHLADYDVAKKFTRSDVLSLVEDIDGAMKSFKRTRTKPEAKFFLACLLVGQNLNRKKSGSPVLANSFLTFLTTSGVNLG